jgi:hypothetical protein
MAVWVAIVVAVLVAVESVAIWEHVRQYVFVHPESRTRGGSPPLSSLASASLNTSDHGLYSDTRWTLSYGNHNNQVLY